jgi:hypothetical protein
LLNMAYKDIKTGYQRKVKDRKELKPRQRKWE